MDWNAKNQLLSESHLPTVDLCAWCFLIKGHCNFSSYLIKSQWLIGRMWFIFIIIVKEIFNKMCVLIRMAKKRGISPTAQPVWSSWIGNVNTSSYFLICYLLEGSAKSPDLGASLTGHRYQKTTMLAKQWQTTEPSPYLPAGPGIVSNNECALSIQLSIQSCMNTSCSGIGHWESRAVERYPSPCLTGTVSQSPAWSQPPIWVLVYEPRF